MCRIVVSLLFATMLPAQTPAKELCQREGVCVDQCSEGHQHLTAPVVCCFRTFDVSIVKEQRKIDCQFRGGIQEAIGKPNYYCCAKNFHSHHIWGDDTSSSANSTVSPGFAIPGVYIYNRMLGKDLASYRSNPISHTYIITVQEDWNLGHTYSWGNTRDTKGWSKDTNQDLVAARAGLEGKVSMEIVGDSALIPFIEEAYDLVSKPEYKHVNLWVDNNCKTEANNMVTLAKTMKQKKK